MGLGMRLPRMSGPRRAPLQRVTTFESPVHFLKPEAPSAGPSLSRGRSRHRPRSPVRRQMWFLRLPVLALSSSAQTVPRVRRGKLRSGPPGTYLFRAQFRLAAASPCHRMGPSPHPLWTSLAQAPEDLARSQLTHQRPMRLVRRSWLLTVPELMPRTSD